MKKYLVVIFSFILVFSNSFTVYATYNSGNEVKDYFVNSGIYGASDYISLADSVDIPGFSTACGLADLFGNYLGVSNITDQAYALAVGDKNLSQVTLEFMGGFIFGETPGYLSDLLEILPGWGGVSDALGGYSDYKNFSDKKSLLDDLVDAFKALDPTGGGSSDKNSFGDSFGNGVANREEETELIYPLSDDTPGDDSQDSKMPFIYIYTQDSESFELSFDAPELLIETDPVYSSSFKVTSDIEGITTVDGKPYRYIYYESELSDRWTQREQGVLIHGSSLRSDLRDLALSYGFVDQEVEDFVDCWASFLEMQDYVVYPQLTETVDLVMPISVSSIEFDTYSRVWFVFQPAEHAPGYQEPDSYNITRSGNTLVEWGGYVLW